MTLKEDMQRLESDFESLKNNLTIRESELAYLRKEKVSLEEKLGKYDSKRDEWRRSTKQLEEFFTE